MSQSIFKSHRPDKPILTTSIFTRVLSSRTPAADDVGGFPGSSTAFIDGATGTSLTRKQLLDLSLSFAYGIQNRPATAPFATRGSTALIYSPNSLAWPVVLFGCVAAGLRCTTANSAYVARELAHQYSDSGSGLVLTAEEGISVVRAMFSEMGISHQEGDKRTIILGRDLRWAGGPAAPVDADCRGLLTLSDLLSGGKLNSEAKFEGALAHETVYLCYSSGTTGKPKGVELSHQNITTILDILAADLFSGVKTPTGNCTTLGFLPFYHLYGLAAILQCTVVLGWSTVIHSQFNPEQFCAAIEKYKVSLAFIVPPVLVVLARHPAVDKYDLSSLEYMLSGAAPLGADLVKQVQRRLGAKRPEGAKVCAIGQAYGLTETSTATHVYNFTETDAKVGSVGTLCSNLEARIVQDEDGIVDAEEGTPGELWVRGKTIMKGYLNNPTATSNSITPDGWFKTGDILVKDKDSYYWVVDRKKELIKYKAFQVAPAELESVLLTHPDIADAAVIGVDSPEQATELPRAYVVHARPQEVMSADRKLAFAQSVVKWMESQVAKHKFLRGGVKVIDTVPKSAAGKILRRELRELAKQEAARGELNTVIKARL
ncbi:AMP binding protein [Favolaschia claudopus]|uniref:AMP binding protein n=1 Tax=Favolaschia claudopus TaxID=2862362 RepID=A0AAW0D1P3_9AGAR